jgi:LysM repeat protein
MGRKGKELWVVSRGDTLTDIAKYVYGDARLYKVLAEASGVGNPDHIKPGQKIKLPTKLKSARRQDSIDKNSAAESDGLSTKGQKRMASKGGGGKKEPFEATPKAANSISVDELALYLYYGRLRYRNSSNLTIEHSAVQTLKFKSRQDFTKFMRDAEQRVFDDGHYYELYRPKDGVWPVKGTVPKFKGKELDKEVMRRYHEKSK